MMTFLISTQTTHLGPDEKLDTVGAQVLEEGGGVSDQDPDQRLLRDGVDRRVELRVIHEGEAVPENIGEYCNEDYYSKPTFQADRDK